MKIDWKIELEKIICNNNEVKKKDLHSNYNLIELRTRKSLYIKKYNELLDDTILKDLAPLVSIEIQMIDLKIQKLISKEK